MSSPDFIVKGRVLDRHFTLMHFLAHENNKTLNEIANTLKCNPGTVAYHLQFPLTNPPSMRRSHGRKQSRDQKTKVDRRRKLLKAAITKKVTDQKDHRP